MNIDTNEVRRTYVPPDGAVDVVPMLLDEIERLRGELADTIKALGEA